MFLQMQTTMWGGSRETDVWLALQMGWNIPHHHFKTLTLFLLQKDRKCILFPLCGSHDFILRENTSTPRNSLGPWLSLWAATRWNGSAVVFQDQPSPICIQWLNSIYEADIALQLLSEFPLGKKAGEDKGWRGNLHFQKKKKENMQRKISWLVPVIRDFFGPLPPGPRLECSSSTDSPSVSYCVLLARPFHSFILLKARKLFINGYFKIVFCTMVWYHFWKTVSSICDVDHVPISCCPTFYVQV